MRAVLWTAYGPPEVLRLGEVERPVPGDGQLLVRVHASTVTAGEVELRRFRFWSVLTIPLRLYFGVLRPRGRRIPGQELAGEVVEIGCDVSNFAVGDRVFGQTGLRFGAHAEYAVLSANGAVARIPEGVTFRQATTLPTAGLYAVFFTDRAEIRPGMSVLINGGGGSIGSFAIQLAKRAGAEVTAVDRTDKLAFMERLGADHVIDHTKDDFTSRRDAYDTILDVVDKSSFLRAAPTLRPGGLYLHTDISPWHALRRRMYRAPDGRRADFVTGRDSPANLERLAEMVASGELRVVIDREYVLEDILEAHRYTETGAKQGHLVVAVTPTDE